MKILRLICPLSLLCRVLKASRSGYYAWSKRTPSKRALEEKRLALEIRAAHKRNRETCGPERLQKDLAENGIMVGIHRIRKIRKKLGIRCKQTKKFKATTNSKHAVAVAQNLLEQNFAVSFPNKVWVSDITYIATREGWLYCAAHKDLFNGEIVGHALGERTTKNLIVSSLLMAIQRKQPGPGLIHHSDRGSQYCSYEFTKLLDLFKIRASMSKKRQLL